MAFLTGFYDLYSQYLRMVYDFLNTACNTEYVYFIIYFITTINFIVAIYKLVIGLAHYFGAKTSFGSSSSSGSGSKGYKFKSKNKDNSDKND